MSYTDTISSAQRSTLDMVTSMQDRVVEWNRSVAEVMGGWMSAVPVPPVAQEAFKPEYLEAPFQFTQELIEANRRFTMNLLEAWAPKTSGGHGQPSHD